MNTREFYALAQSDILFREQRLAEARFHSKLAIVLGITFVGAWLGYVAYCGIAEHRWPGDVGLGIALVLCWSLYAQAQTRLGALEAMYAEGSNRVAGSN
jgi:hypothetical protein